MSAPSVHDDWLSLIEISGPFLAVPVLKEAFPQGLEELDATKRKRLRQAYEEWREALELEDAQFGELHLAWIDEVLSLGLELDEDGKGDVLKRTNWCAASLKASLPEHGVTLSPDLAVIDEQRSNKPLLLIHIYAQDVDLDATLKQDGWAATPADRMVQLCRSLGCRLGLVTNGERWMLVDAPVGAVTTFASWYARIWSQEPITLQVFVHLLGIRRFFVDESEQLPALFDRSLKFQDEVTDALGEQVRRAVEVLIQTLDKADQDRNRELLHDVKEPELYEAALTVMMRLVFLLSAEERGLLLMGDERYEANYALSTLRMQLRKESEEILERRWDAWSRLLAIFRAVFGGIEHENLRLPALGGSLFDPDRFPFLEGRAKGSDWRSDAAKPLPIDNRTVLLLLEAIQQFQGRTLSYRALDVEQIGYVYEGLLERTVKRTDEVTLELDATKSAKTPWIKLAELDSARLDGTARLAELLQERSGSSASRVRNDLAKPVDDILADRLLTACQGDTKLRDRVKPYVHMLRTDPWGYPLVYPAGAFIVTTGSDRRETGTHYTPKSLTEAIVAETLTPVAYVGPAEGKPREQWALKSPAELLDLKICDPAMGSGAFLVQACRWLSDRLVESWSHVEATGKTLSVDGEVLEAEDAKEPLPRDSEARTVIARRLIAERCLYGVDMNPLAVELAKLSIWLVTLAKGRPFGFLDHNLRCGDSLLGIHRLDQLTELSMTPTGKGQQRLFGQNIESVVREAIRVRTELREIPIRDIHDVEAMARLNKQVNESLGAPEDIANAIVSATILFHKKKKILKETLDGIAIWADRIFSKELAGDQWGTKHPIADVSNTALIDRRPFHWPLAFPEVFSEIHSGFDAVIGNPPYINAVAMYEGQGSSLMKPYYNHVFSSASGSYDIYVLFIERANQVSRANGLSGLLIPNKVLSSEYAEEVRRLLISKAAIVSVLDYSAVRVFAASVYPVVVVSKKTPLGGMVRVWSAKTNRDVVVEQSAFAKAPSLLWGYLLTDYSEIVSRALLRSEPLGMQANVLGAATVSEAYEIANHVHDLDGNLVPEFHAKFIVSGNVRPYASTWNSSPVQYLKTRYSKPIVDLREIPLKRRSQALTKKVIVSGMAKRPVAFYDEKAEYLSGKSTVILTGTNDSVDLNTLCVLLNSKVSALIYLALYGGLAMAGGYLRFGSPQLAALPIPKGFLNTRLDGLSPEEQEAVVCEAYGLRSDEVKAAFRRSFGSVDAADMEVAIDEDLTSDEVNGEEL
jgi:Eco57I restriction-modification methylase/TaqI-like C-terminal specificity domain